MELAVPYVVLQPSVDEIQRAVNNVAKKILKASHEIRRWGNTDLNGDEENVPGVDYDNIGTGTFYDEIASDIEIVKLVLLLTGSVNGLKNEVQAHLDAYAEYSFLYLENLQQAYDDFTRKKPSLEQFEAELKKYMDIEQRVLRLAPVHNIGALCLDTQPLKLALEPRRRRGRRSLLRIFMRTERSSLRVSSSTSRRPPSCSAATWRTSTTCAR